MDPTELDYLLRVLRDHSVRRAKIGDMEFEFEPSIPESEAKGFDEKLLEERETGARLALTRTPRDVKFPGS